MSKGMIPNEAKKILKCLLGSQQSTFFDPKPKPILPNDFLNSERYQNIYWDLYIGARHDSCGAYARLIILANQDDVKACWSLVLAYKDSKHGKNDAEAIRWINKILEIEKCRPANEKYFSNKAKGLLSDLLDVQAQVSYHSSTFSRM